VIGIVATIAVSLALGFTARRRLGPRADGAARALLNTMLYVLFPPVAFIAVTRLRVDTGVLSGVALGWAALALTGLTAWLVGTRLLHLPRPSVGALIATAMQGNTGFLGFPLTVALLGPDALGAAAVYDGLVQAPVFLLGVFAVAAAFGGRTNPDDRSLRTRLTTALLCNPPLLAVLLGFIVPSRALPAQADTVATVIATLLLLPLGFLAVGITLAAEARPVTAHGHPRRPDHAVVLPVVVGTVLRLLISPVLLLALSAPLLTLPRAYPLLAAMPAGVTGLVVAHAYGLDRDLIARIVVATTAVVAVVGVAAAAIN